MYFKYMDCIKTQFVAFDEVLGIDSVIQLRGSCQANPFVIDSQSIGCRNLAEDNVSNIFALPRKPIFTEASEQCSLSEQYGIS